MFNIPRIFIEVPSFTKKWFDLGFTDDDLAELQNILINDPESGDMMKETGGIRKIRVAFSNRGKSGSSRVCYVDFAFYETIYLLNVFAKDEKANLTDIEKKELKRLVKSLKDEASKNHRGKKI